MSLCPPPSPPTHPKSCHLDPPHPTPIFAPPGPLPPHRPSRSPPPQAPPRTPPPIRPCLNPPHPPPQGASGQQLVGGVVGVQNRGVTPPPPGRYLNEEPLALGAVELSAAVGAKWAKVEIHAGRDVVQAGMGVESPNRC